MQAGQEVLVVDRSGETTAVLRAVFEPRGVRVTSCPPRRMARLDQASSAAVPHPVMVVDVDETPDDVLEKMANGQRPLVLIGRIETSDGEPADPPDGAAHLLKPFHYADLIRTVEAAIRTRTA